MKKFVALFISILMLFSIAACDAPALIVDLVKDKGWDTVYKYEKSTYEIKKYTRKKVGDVDTNDVCIAEGMVTMTIEKDFKTENDSSFSRLVTDYIVKYNDVPEAIEKLKDNTGKPYDRDNRGKTDTMKSEVIFYTDGLIPSRSEKTFNLEVRENEKENLSYSYTADYKAGSATIIMDGKESTLPISGVNVFDNEQIFIVARALKGNAGNFYLSNIYSCFDSGAYFKHPMAVTNDNAKTPLEVGENLNKYLTAREDGKYKVNCSEITIKINDPKSGPPIKLLMTSKDEADKDEFFKISDNISTNKIIMQITQVEYDINRAGELYNTVHTLKDYTVIR